jgi:uncharacterized protein
MGTKEETAMGIAMRLPAEQARRLALHAQGLDGSWTLPSGKPGVVEAVQRLGYVQIDTIHVVQRAHHHTLWSRCRAYAPPMLDELQAKDRLVFEYWAHAAAFLPMSCYRYSLPRMKAYANSSRTGGFLKANKRLAAEIKSRITAEGPLSAADFETPAGHPRGSWWNWKPAKRALEAMFATGELMVSHRVNFQRFYDLAERVLPPGTDTTCPDADEAARLGVRQVLASCGLLGLRHGWYHGRKSAVQALHELVSAGEAVPVAVEGLPNATFFALKDSLASLPRPARKKPLHILSPFDSLVIWRKPLLELFGFDYKLECYVPAPRRRWGYFCLPLLWGDRFLGRMDAVADRPAKKLLVRSLQFEAGAEDAEESLPALGARIREFAAFNECERVEIEQVTPRKLGPNVRAAVRSE